MRMLESNAKGSSMNKASAMRRRRLRALASLMLAMLLTTALGLPPLSVPRSMADGLGSIELACESALPQVTQGNAQYSLEGALFGVYSDYECTRYIGSLATDADGTATMDDVAAGRYFIREEQPSTGYAMSNRLYQTEVGQSAVASVEVVVAPYAATPQVLIQETNAETGAQASCTGASLGSAEYVVSHYDGSDESRILSGAMRTWTMRSNENGKVVLDEASLLDGSPLYRDGNGNAALPLGHYTVSMTKAPAGYVTPSTVLAFDIAEPSEPGCDPAIAFEPIDEELQVVRGDVMFRKVDEHGTPLPGIPFLLAHEGDGIDAKAESHVIVTDENGDFSSHAEYVAHSQHANANDDAVIANVEGAYALDESKLSNATGIWFSEDELGNRCLPDDARGALPYGSYTLRELPCAKNEGMNLVTTQFSIYQDGFTVKLDNIVNTRPGLNGCACDDADLDKLVKPAQNASIAQTIDYRNLVVGNDYDLACSAYVKSTGAPLQRADGSECRASMELAPTSSSGSTTLRLEGNTSTLAGETIVVRATLLSSDGTVIAQTAEDELNEVVVEPFTIAEAHDALDGDKYVMGAEASVLEYVQYEGFAPGEKYFVACTLNDKATGSALRDSLGNVIAVRREFVPTESFGSVELTLPVDTSAIAGHDIVVFNAIHDAEENVVASNQDIEDASQTLKTVKLSSNAYDKADGDKMFDSKSANVCIVDTVSYANLIPGDQYEVHGALMDKETGCALMEDDEPVTATVPFVPEEVSGTVDVEYEFDASAQSSQVLVAFEAIEHAGNVVAEDADLEDVAQTVTSEDVDPDGLTAIDDDATPLSGYGSPKMGDIILRIVVPALSILAAIAAIVAIALHRRRKGIESVARTSELVE